MLFERQKCLLALVDSLGGDVGALDFQKLLFLYCREVETTPSYEFVPYRFGGFSFTCDADKRRLIEQGLLADEERCWKLTPASRRVATVAPMVRMRMDQFARRHAKLRGDALVTTDISSGDRLIQETLADHVHGVVGWESLSTLTADQQPAPVH